jgi:hypothetical protein
MNKSALVFVLFYFMACTTTSSQTATNSASLDTFRGTYRGFAPTDESAVMMGEAEVKIGQGQIMWRIATGHKIIEKAMSFDKFQLMTEAEVAKTYTDGSPFAARTTGFRSKKGYPKLLFIKNPKSNPLEPGDSEVGLIVITGGIEDTISPQMFYNPVQVARGDYKRMLDHLKKQAASVWGTVPLIANGGK